MISNSSVKVKGSKGRMRSVVLQLSLLTGGILFLACVLLSKVSVDIATTVITSEVNDELERLAKASAKNVSITMKAELDKLNLVALNSAVRGYENNWEDAYAELKASAKSETYIIDMAISDLKGNVKSVTGYTTNSSDAVWFKGALQGKPVITDPTYDEVQKKVCMMYAVPIKEGSKVTGVLFAVVDGVSLSKIIDSTKYSDESTSFMLNKEGTAVANSDITKVEKADNIFDNYKKDKKLAEMATVLRKMVSGGQGHGTYTYNKVVKSVGYAPVVGTEWSLGISVPETIALEKLDNLKSSMLKAAVTIVLLSLVAMVLFSTLLVRPLVILSKHMNRMAGGDFTGNIPEVILKRKNEIGELGNAVYEMQKSVGDIIKGVILESKEVSELARVEETSMHMLAQHIEDVSATTEELSAGSEESAAAIEEMTATSNEIESAITSVAQRAGEGLATANEIINRANTLKQRALESNESAVKVYKDTETQLKEAVVKSKSVEEINNLANAILQIAEQTNLLSLNASIEAARAGDAGRGFAVVAGEIRKLADNSKSTVTEIQKVNTRVIESVANLSDSSLGMLKFIDTTVLQDYASLVKISEQYNVDAVTVTELVTELSATSQQLSASMESMVRSLNEIAISVNEGAQGTTQIATRTSSITDSSKEVLDCAKQTNEKVEKLLELVAHIQV